jgi:hypothetical protein
MKIGTKSILFGAHCFLIHPIFIAIAWIKLYGFPWKIQYWIAFFVHDLGYWGKPNMDGQEGETHVELGAKIMDFFFGKEWSNFTKYHSRYYAEKDKANFSKLCVADKLAVVLEPTWLYLPRVILSGEVKEYMELVKNGGKYSSVNIDTNSKRSWFRDVKKKLKKWVYENKI